MSGGARLLALMVSPCDRTEREDLRDLADALGRSFSEQQTHPHRHKLRMPQETKQDARLLVGVDSPDRHDPLYHGRLANVADVNGCLEPGVDRCRMEQHAHCCLSTHQLQFKYKVCKRQTPILDCRLFIN